MSDKARYWVGVCYPENMIEGWENEISEKLQLPFAYCIHNKCCTTEKEERKVHVHIMICFPNTTTKKTALSLLNKLSLHNMVCCPSCEQVHNVRFMYNYLIHNTEDSKKKGKYQYDPSERITGNGFDIGCYEQVSTQDKLNMAFELSELIVSEGFEDFLCFYKFVVSNYDFAYFEILKSNSGFYTNLCKGNFLHNHQSPQIITKVIRK